jgi:hypothetical protein
MTEFDQLQWVTRRAALLHGILFSVLVLSDIAIFFNLWMIREDMGRLLRKHEAVPASNSNIVTVERPKTDVDLIEAEMIRLRNLKGN